MNTAEFKQKLKDNLISDEELDHLLNSKQQHQRSKSGSVINNLIKGYIESYTTSKSLKIALESLLIFVIITGVIFLSYAGKMDSTISSVVLASVLGFIFGKMK